jgi:glycosyltransferase involved in cell wall biosynthesis
MSGKFVTAFNGSREDYEIPLALHEMGLLERHVSDVYLPDSLVLPAKHLCPLALRRHRPGLPSGKVRCVARALLPQAVNLLRQRTKAPGCYEAIDRTLSLEAGRIAERAEAHLFLHSGYALWAFERHSQRRRWLYQFHPHPLSVYDILREDFSAHSEVRESFDTEIDSQDPASLSVALTSEWQLADRIFCASTFTARSLVRQGCREDRIHVVPYGGFARPIRAPSKSSSGRCRFLFVGQGVQRKGIHHLLKAWLLASLGDCDLSIVGRKMDSGMLPLLDQPGVRYHHDVSEPERDRLYGAADVFVMPSLVEGFGLVYIEALAAGLYCIGTPNTGLPDLRPPPDVAAIVEAGDVEGLAGALTDAHRLWRSGDLSKAEIARFGRQRSSSVHREELRQAIALNT